MESVPCVLRPVGDLRGSQGLLLKGKLLKNIRRCCGKDLVIYYLVSASAIATVWWCLKLEPRSINDDMDDCKGKREDIVPLKIGKFIHDHDDTILKWLCEFAYTGIVF